ncbi:winged helix-turn-helix domain-containing protein [Roseomonas marmotae]|uniref:LysR family transcriptional regulator n=1 Tax=Roseomonas marmotae TaxID=2768161 RepID=A0ABS3KEM3_9PROT|nr:LysR family transcriptional regulator [Roseomonas marmotae]MBO1075895.1 LysR family transcriptional regulator [Roseomonas marmotae]QTI81920.1 LysR family transcriptional regulator [Roseomonas marmotae]
MIRIDLGAGRRLGPGKVALLEAIAETGSISAAARQMRMSYKRAWSLVEEMNGYGPQPVVAAAPGGARGGGASLTEQGRRLAELYRAVEAAAGAAAEAPLRALAALTGPGT